MPVSPNILVLIEHRDGEILKPSLEVLGEALDIADSAGEIRPEVTAALLLKSEVRSQKSEVSGALVEKLAGYGASWSMVEELASYGANRILLVSHPALAHFDAMVWAEALIQLINSSSLIPHPSSLLLAATPNGRELAPRLAVKMGGGLIADSVRVRWEVSPAGQPEIGATVPLYGDRVYSQQQVAVTNAVISFRPGARGLDRPGERGRITPEILEFQPDLSNLPQGIEHIAFIPADPRTVSLSEADKIVCGGAGVGQEGFDSMWQLADLLGAAVGGTRVAVDKGWLEWERQIGQTGQVVAPRLFLSCGTSGASQHVTGMKDSRTVIVINNDRNAPMFSLADIGLVGDVHAIVPALIEKLRQLQGETAETAPKEEVANYS
jgi:electron transfer flavoprotein alpha subunit